MLAKIKRNFDVCTKEEIRVLEAIIRNHYHHRRLKEVKRSIIPGNNSSM
jgi:hypothetical protein